MTRPHYELERWLKPKAQQGHVALPNVYGILRCILNDNCHQGLVPWTDPLDDSDDSEDDYWGDDLGNYADGYDGGDGC